ncbi:DUF928 domain-containing protein [Candidatus Poribacteria bacterium]|nr:DUF928 domain-containing protein [Candidatus Poribacteria bacterium]
MMNNESYDEIQPTTQVMLEHYILLKRQGAAPAIEEFVKQYPEEYRQTLQEQIEEYEQLGLLFAAYQQRQEEKFESELSEEDVNEGARRFQQMLAARVEELPADLKVGWFGELWALLTTRWPVALAYGLAVIVGGLAIFFFSQNAQYRGLDRQLATLTESIRTLQQQNTSLQQENEALRKQVTEAVALNEQTRQRLTTQQTTLEQEVAQLKNENEELTTLLAQRTTQLRDLVSLQDTADLVTIDSDGTVSLGKATLPPSLSQTVFDLVTKGEVPSSEPVRVAMATLRDDATRGTLRTIRSAAEKKPVPKSPVLTAIRSTTPTLQWEAVSGAEQYKFTIADPDDKVVWQGNARTQTQVTVPSDVLQWGKTYFWQVEAIVEGQSRLSPPVGFWVIDEKTWREVETAERNYPTSALVLASVYEAHGLYEEALAQLERLANMNPTNPFAQVMLQNLRRQLGKEEK